MKKLEPQELEKLQNLIDKKNTSSMNIGIAAVTKEIEVRKANLLLHDANVNFQNTLEKEMNASKITESKIEDLIKDFNKKYGNHQYNIETGELIVPPKE